MNGPSYHEAFEHAKLRLGQLTADLESLENRQTVLLNAMKAIETFFASRAQNRPSIDQNSSAVVAINRDVIGQDRSIDRLSSGSVKTLIHGEVSKSQIERRIEAAIGR